MKIQEFRDKMKAAEREDLEKVAAELYRKLPKAAKEEVADPLIEDILAHKETAKRTTAKRTTANAAVGFPALKDEIEQFLSYVDDDLYIVPNRVVPKQKRSKWRFEMKSYIKQLERVTDDENGEEATRLLRELYHRLCRGCAHYIFQSEDPFRAVGISQVDLYERLLHRTFANGYTKEKLKNMLMDAVVADLDRETLHIQLERAFVAALPTADMRCLAIETAKQAVTEYEQRLQPTTGKQRAYFLSSGEYEVREAIRNLCETILCLGLALGEGEEKAEYYALHSREASREQTLYRALHIIWMMGGSAVLWKKVYDTAVREGIKPRESLERMYQEISRTGALPEEW